MAAQRSVWIGLDVGSTEIKATAVGDNGAVLAARGLPTPWRFRSGGAAGSQADLDADDVLRLVREVCAGVLDDCARLPASTGGGDGTGAAGVRAAGIGVTGLAESGVLVDAGNRPVTRAMAWFDHRGEDLLPGLGAAFAAEFPQRTGLPLTHQCTLPKLLWLAREEPEAYAAGRLWLNLLEYVVVGLGGRPVADVTLACRTGLYDLDAGTWWPEAVAAISKDASFLPPLTPSGTPAGRVPETEPVAGLRGAVLTVAGHDHTVAAFGAGAAHPGDVLHSCGTAEVLLITVPDLLPRAARAQLAALGITHGTHVVPGASTLLAGTQAGLVLRRVLTLLGADKRHESLDAAALALDPADLPDLELRGFAFTEPRTCIDGIDDGTTPPVLWRVALEAAMRRTTDLLAAVHAVGVETPRVVGTGGWFGSVAYRTLKEAAIPGLEVYAGPQAGPVGAAMLARTAAAGRAHLGTA